MNSEAFSIFATIRLPSEKRKPCIIDSVQGVSMITEYHRPTTLDEALTFLSQPDTLPLGGGTLLSHTSTSLSASPAPDPVSVVDLQALGLNRIHKKGNNL